MSVSREKLYEEIWAEPITKVSKRYEVSDSYLIRVLKNLNIPRPPRGYWAMVAANIHTERPPLPKARLGDSISWCRAGAVEYARETTIKLEPSPRPKIIPNFTTHPLVSEARLHFKDVRESSSLYLKPYKKVLMDLIVSNESLEHALDIANQFFIMLEKLGHQVQILPSNVRFRRSEIDEREITKPQRYYSELWRPLRPTVVYIQDIGIGITIFEISESVEVGYIKGQYFPVAEYWKHPNVKNKSVFSWTTHKDLPSRRLCIQAYSTHLGTDWQKQWRESKPEEFPKRLKSIVNELCNSVTEVADATNTAIKEAEDQRRKWEERLENERIKAENERRIKNLNNSRNELFSIIESWGKTRQIEEFFKDIQLQAKKLSAIERETIVSRLIEARKLLGNEDSVEQFMKWKSAEERDHKE